MVVWRSVVVSPWARLLRARVRSLRGRCWRQVRCAQRTVDGRTNIDANLWNVSGGGSVAAANVVSVKINSDWLGIDQQQVEYTLALGSFTSSNICKLAGRGTVAVADAVGLLYASTRAWAGGGPAAGGIGAAGVDGGYLPAGQFRSDRYDSAQDC